jgi:pimeloyl-ACP methyl ester carboxylesterase
VPHVQNGDASIYFEEFGSGYPVILFAPGSLQSSIDYWRRPAAPINPLDLLAPHFRLIAVDQRNAGRSRAPITESDSWSDYTADHIAVLDELGIEECHVLGQCIGVPFAMSLIRAQPSRIRAAALLQPSGRVGPHRGRTESFNQWAASLQDHPEATEAVLDRFFENLYTPDFVYTVPREFVPTCNQPFLVLAGNDQAHPFEVSEEFVRLARDAEFIPEWKQGPARDAAAKRILEFLLQHTPVAQTTSQTSGRT